MNSGVNESGWRWYWGVTVLVRVVGSNQDEINIDNVDNTYNCNNRNL